MQPPHTKISTGLRYDVHVDMSLLIARATPVLAIFLQAHLHSCTAKLSTPSVNSIRHTNGPIASLLARAPKMAHTSATI
jgi:hypothetical protein